MIRSFLLFLSLFICTSIFAVRDDTVSTAGKVQIDQTGGSNGASYREKLKALNARKAERATDNSSSGSGHQNDNDEKEKTPESDPDKFKPVKKTKAKKNKETKEIWVKDQLHHGSTEHWEVYKHKRDFEKGIRNRAVWSDGRMKNRY